jgi:DNA-binding Lrp family transcriptional regulator
LSLPLRSWTSAEIPNPQPPLDDLDRALVDELITNGHDANRKLARRLRVSDGTVRARIARLEDAGLLRIVTGVDPVATGQIVRTALAFITCHPPADDIVDRLRQHPLVLGAHRCVGRADLALQVGAGSDDELAAFLSRDLRTQPGVGEIEVATIANVVDRRSHLVRFADIA